MDKAIFVYPFCCAAMPFLLDTAPKKHTFIPVKELTSETKKVFTGYAASPGMVRGITRIIYFPAEFKRFKPGEILVASTTDPIWSTPFPVAKAVITEMGGILPMQPL